MFGYPICFHRTARRDVMLVDVHRVPLLVFLRDAFRILQSGFVTTLILTIAVAASPRLLYGQANKPLALDQVERLVRVGAPDSAIAGEIKNRGLSFVPSTDTLTTLRQAGAGAQTLLAVDKLRSLLADYRPAGSVNDFAQIIGSPARTQIESLCKDIDQRSHSQIVVVTIPSLRGHSLEEFSLALANAWAIGDKRDNRGVMVLLARDDRQYRIEVGLGLESILTDSIAGDLGREMVPMLQHGDYGGALLHLIQRISEVLANSSKLNNCDPKQKLSAHPPEIILPSLAARYTQYNPAS